MLDKIKNWAFLDEPLYRWALFIVALTFILFAWRSTLKLAQNVVD
jgi:hypothetical protein